MVGTGGRSRSGALVPLDARHLARPSYHPVLRRDPAPRRSALVTPPLPTAERPADLEQRFATGDPAVLREVYDAHGALIYNLCRRVVGDAHAADVSQEVWVAAWRSCGRYRPEAGSLAGWLVGIARFKAIDHLRRSARRPALDDGADAAERLDRSGTGERPAAEVVAERLLLADALRQLDERPRAVLELAFYSELTHQEIAERTGVPLGTVKSDIRRGLERLRRHLEGFDAADRP